MSLRIFLLHIFEDLITFCSTQSNEAYIYFFNTLPTIYKGKLIERFSTLQPVNHFGNISMEPAYIYMRTVELSFWLAGASQNSPANDHSSTRVQEISKNVVALPETTTLFLGDL